MNIPEEVLEAAAKAGYEQKMKAPWDRGFASVKDLHRQEAAAIAPVIVEWARKEALREAQDAVAEVFPYGAELNSDGSESPGMAAWVEGGHDAWAAIGALRSDTEASS